MMSRLDHENKILFVYGTREDTQAHPVAPPEGYRPVVFEYGGAPLQDCLRPLLRNHL